MFHSLIISDSKLQAHSGTGLSGEDASWKGVFEKIHTFVWESIGTGSTKCLPLDNCLMVGNDPAEPDMAEFIGMKEVFK